VPRFTAEPSLGASTVPSVKSIWLGAGAGAGDAGDIVLEVGSESALRPYGLGEPPAEQAATMKLDSR